MIRKAGLANQYICTHTVVNFSLLNFALWTVFMENYIKIICFSHTQQYFIIYFNLLATSFGR